MSSSFPAPDPNAARLEARRERLEAEESARAAERISLQEAERKANERATLMAERRAADVKAGRAPILSASDAEAFHDAIKGEEILFSPPVAGGEGRWYSVHGWITLSEKDMYLSWWPDMDWSLPKVGFAVLKPKIMGDLRYRQPVRLVSKYVRTRAIPLANGGTAMIPVFEGGYIFAE